MQKTKSNIRDSQIGDLKQLARKRRDMEIETPMFGAVKALNVKTSTHGYDTTSGHFEGSVAQCTLHNHTL